MSNVLEMKTVASDYLLGADKLASACRYIAGQYSAGMARQEAQSHFDTRVLLINTQNKLLTEAEKIFASREDRQ